MIYQLVELGKQIRTTHDAIKFEPIDIDLVIKDDGSFVSFSIIDRIKRPAEAIIAKKGKARLLLDKAEEVLCYSGNELQNILKKRNVDPSDFDKINSYKKEAERSATFKHSLFLKKLNEYASLEILKPVFLFYYDNKENGLERALASFEEQVPVKFREGNIAFRMGDVRIHEHESVLEAIMKRYDQNVSSGKNDKICSICGKNLFPITDGPHGMVKNVPGGNTTGCALISFNSNAFESYNLSRNENSSICSNCARNYVEALNYLNNNGKEVLEEDKKGKKIQRFRYSNRKTLGDDTSLLFWTKVDVSLDELDLLDAPDSEQVALLIDSVKRGYFDTSTGFEDNKFYSLSISGAASRIIVRDWIELSLPEYKRNISNWFRDIEIINNDKLIFPSLFQLSNATQRTDASEKTMSARTSRILWRAALKNEAIPLWLLATVIKRISHIVLDKDGKPINSFTPAKASLIKIILNRNLKRNEKMMKERLDLENNAPAYICGRIFAVMEGIQRAALGKEINAGIRERFFSAASSSPASTFGRILRLTQSHLSKIRQEKAGLATMLDIELQMLCSKIEAFPNTLTLEEQGQFALGYYHQKQQSFEKAKQTKELESITENIMEE